jgi:hypothetical protein
VVPKCFCEYGIHWFNILREYLGRLKEMIAKQDIPQQVLVEYSAKRRERLDFLRALLHHPSRQILSELRAHTDFCSYLVNSMLKDTSKFEMILKVVPSDFAKFNHSFPLRNEGITFLKEILNCRANCDSFFHQVAKVIRESNVLANEAKLIKHRSSDRTFRRTSMNLLNVLCTEGDLFQMNSAIVTSDALRLLKEEALNDWEEFQRQRGSWSNVQMTGKSVLERVKGLYDGA